MLLRHLPPDDLEEFFDLHGREDVARYLPWDTRDEAGRARGPRAAPGDEAGGRRGRRSPSPASTRRPAGWSASFVLFLRSVEHRGGEVGYIVHPDFQGRGLATEGARHLLGIAFGRLGLHRVIARIDARNRASARGADPLGMRHEARLVENELFKGEWGDEDDFAILDREWEARPSD